MRILLLHANSFYFKPLTKAIEKAEPIEIKEKKVDEAIVVFVAIEKDDDKNCVEKLVDEIVAVNKQVKAKNVVLYPFVHLTSNPSSPSLALTLLIEAEEKLKSIFGENFCRAPFGWYKEFKIDVKGHPLSELSRQIGIKVEEKSEKKKSVEENQKKQEKQEKDYKKLLRLLKASKFKLDISKLKENDHRILAQKMDLFSFSEFSPGTIFWHPKGLFVRQLLIEFMRNLLREYRYVEIQTPEILDKRLWLISGHWEKYKENIFVTNYDERECAIKPMNCPGTILIYKQKPHSYKELPMRISEFGIVHRQELSGVVGGALRVIQMTQDDAHIFCAENQIEQEVTHLIELVDYIYRFFGFEYRVTLSTRPKKRIGSDELWDKAENALKKVLEKRMKKANYKIAEGEGAFYGPKIDFHIKDSQGREWQLATIQLDFSMPERFDISYIDKDGKEKRPVMIHRAILGSIERFIAILLEHTNGKLPFWLSPIQCRIIPVSEKYNEEAIEIANDFNKHKEVRTDVDDRKLSVSKKIMEAEIERIPFVLVLGKKELENEMFSIRERDSKKIEEMEPKKFREIVKKLQEKVDIDFKPIPVEPLLSKRLSFL